MTVQTQGQTRRPRSWAWLMMLLVPVLLGGLGGTLLIGAVPTSVGEVWAALSGDTASPAYDPVFSARLPRMMMALLLGAGLGASGALMQLITRNPLASPYTMGLSATAEFVMVLSLAYLPFLSTLGPLPAFAGAALGGALVICYAVSAPQSGIVTLALTGMAVHLLFSALSQAVILLNDRAVDVLFWLSGTLAGTQWASVSQAAPVTVISLLIALFSSSRLYALTLGRDTVISLGYSFLGLTALAGVLVIFLAGTAVAFAGPIGFIGLMVPHIVRRLMGESPRFFLVACALAGALVLLLADLLARALVYPGEIPTGVVTAVVGAPVFLTLALRYRGRQEMN